MNMQFICEHRSFNDTTIVLRIGAVPIAHSLITVVLCADSLVRWFGMSLTTSNANQMLTLLFKFIADSERQFLKESKENVSVLLLYLGRRTKCFVQNKSDSFEWSRFTNKCVISSMSIHSFVCLRYIYTFCSLWSFYSIYRFYFHTSTLYFRFTFIMEKKC